MGNDVKGGERVCLAYFEADFAGSIKRRAEWFPPAVFMRGENLFYGEYFIPR